MTTLLMYEWIFQNGWMNQQLIENSDECGDEYFKIEFHYRKIRMYVLSNELKLRNSWWENEWIYSWINKWMHYLPMNRSN